MFAVIFEVEPREGRFDEYLEFAKRLRPELETIDGFVAIDRLASRRTAGRVLSLSIWRDEKAVVRWRTHAVHHVAQQKGRGEIFADYRLRVGEVTADTALEGGAPVQQRFDTTEIGDAKVATITELVPGAAGTSAVPADRLAAHMGLRADADGLIDTEVFESIYTAGKLLLLAGWRDAASAQSWSPAEQARASLRHRQVRIIRDYGMFERREAPQFYPTMKRDGAAGAKDGAQDGRTSAAAR